MYLLYLIIIVNRKALIALLLLLTALLPIHAEETPVDSLSVPQEEESLLKPLGETVLINAVVWSWDHFVGNRGWADVRWKHIKQNLKSNFVLDTDSYSGNQFSHPYHGSIFFNASRYHGNNYYVSMAYPLVGSITWEYFCETNLPSYNDFLSTGVGGSIIGEAAHRASDLIFDNTKTGLNRVFREIAGTLVNPARGYHRLFSGEMFRVASNPGKRVASEPFTFQVGTYYRHQHELAGKLRNKNLATLDFYLDYGDRFEPRSRQVPFQYFSTHLSVNVAESNPTFSDLDIRGRLYGWTFSSSARQASSSSPQTSTLKDSGAWRHDFAIFQNYRYIDNYGEKGEKRAGNYPLISEAFSFGLSFASERESLSPNSSPEERKERKGLRTSTFFHDFSVNGIGFGGTTADYFRPRYYNFAAGFSLRDQIRFSFTLGSPEARHPLRLTIGNDFYFARLFVPNGGTDLGHRSRYYWGDRGNNSITLNRSYLLCRLSSTLQAVAEYTHYYRRSNYSYLPTVHVESNEFRLGFRYGI